MEPPQAERDAQRMDNLESLKDELAETAPGWCSKDVLTYSHKNIYRLIPTYIYIYIQMCIYI